MRGILSLGVGVDFSRLGRGWRWSDGDWYTLVRTSMWQT
jgi:hypothetical protein